MTSGIVPAIKTVAMEALEASKPCDWMLGEIVSLSPLIVQLNDMNLTSEFLKIGHTFKNGLTEQLVEVGDKVIMLRQSGGQLFYIMDWWDEE